ncbi:MAG: hypothetical protein IK115_14370 [Lachnospiraceae bacterium]|nr:hypothetical protein [Lachnospiraceae bacterium]
MSLSSFLKKSRTLLSGDFREIERNCIEAANARAVKKYSGKGELYCILRLYSDEGGLFNYFLKAAAGISYALQHDMIPVIDMQTKENIFLTKEERKSRNLWEEFFEQPAEISFASVKDKKNRVILENPRMPSGIMGMISYDGQMNYWRRLCRKYIRFSVETWEEIRKYESAFSERKKWLGVLARGTDMLNMGVGHAVQPEFPLLAEKIEEVYEKYGCDGIFLATEDEQILKGMKKQFGDRLFFLEQRRFEGKQDKILGKREDYRNGAIEMNRSYLAATYFLSRCACLITSDTGGAQGVYMMSEGFEYVHCWFLGTMGSSDPETLDINKL